MYVQIPSNLFYFIAGFLTFFALIIVASIISNNTQKRKMSKQVNETVENFFKNINNKKDNK